MGVLSDRHALVCGSSRGIGRACAEALAGQGARVTMLARNAESLQEACAALPVPDGQSHGVLVADFTDWQSVQETTRDFVEKHGPVHVLVNNTGGPAAGPLHEAEPSALAEAFAQHVLCNQALVSVVIPGMRREGYGRIINIVSTSVIIPIKGLGVSNTIRGAMGNWGRTLAAELAPFGITVNNLLPGYTATTRLGDLVRDRADRGTMSEEDVEAAMTACVPTGRFALPHEIGDVCAFLASPAASYLNGVNLPVDGARLATL